MSKVRPAVNLKLIEGRSFILGRQGHIFIDSITASNQHAEIRIVTRKSICGTWIRPTELFC